MPLTSSTAVERIRTSPVGTASGIFVRDPQVAAYSTGTVLDGGTITLTSLTGNMVTETGAQFDLQGAAVSASSHLMQFSPRDDGHDAWSNGGDLELFGNNTISPAPS